MLQNEGAILWTGAKNWFLNGGTVNNYGSCTVSNTALLERRSSGGVNAFNNFGSFTNAGTGEMQFSATNAGVPFNNSGTFHVASGAWMRLLAGGNHTGDFTLVLNSSGLTRLPLLGRQSDIFRRIELRIAEGFRHFHSPKRVSWRPALFTPA